MSNMIQSKIVAILYPGEMGAALGRLLRERGVRVVTTSEARSPRTRSLANEAGIELLPSLDAVLHLADVVISAVPPAAAVEVAEQFAESALAIRRDRIFVDANSVSPMTARHIDDIVASDRTRFVDASIHGLAARLQSQGTLYLSGDAIDAVASLFEPRLRVRRIGNEPGQASAIKMLLGGMSKGLVSLFLELSQLGRAAGLLDDQLHEYRHYYPGIMAAIDRLVPTYPRHAARRADELAELERTMRDFAIEPRLVRAAQQLIEAINELDLTDLFASKGAAGWSMRDVVEAVSEHLPRRDRQKDETPVPLAAFTNSKVSEASEV